MDFAQLKKLFLETQNSLKSTTENFAWNDNESYIRWLGNSLHYVQNSTRLLALAAGNFDQTKNLLSSRFIAHAAEEKGHDKLIVADLKALGVTAKNFEVSFEMQLYMQSLYYWVSPIGKPVGLLGWILSLEGVAAHVGPQVYKTTTTAFGPKATSFLKVHAEADQEHIQSALDLVKGLDADDLKIVADSMELYSHQYQEILKAIDQSHVRKLKKIAA